MTPHLLKYISDCMVEDGMPQTTRAKVMKLLKSHTRKSISDRENRLRIAGRVEIIGFSNVKISGRADAVLGKWPKLFLEYAHKHGPSFNPNEALRYVSEEVNVQFNSKTYPSACWHPKRAPKGLCREIFDTSRRGVWTIRNDVWFR